MGQRFRPPMAGEHTWQQVMDAAEWQCQCDDGLCGKKIHGMRNTGLAVRISELKGDRCPVMHRDGKPLHIIPKDPALLGEFAAWLGAGQLIAVCLGCRRGRDARCTRNLRKMAEEIPEDQLALFDFSEIETKPKEGGPQL